MGADGQSLLNQGFAPLGMRVRWATKGTQLELVVSTAAHRVQERTHGPMDGYVTHAPHDASVAAVPERVYPQYTMIVVVPGHAKAVAIHR